MRDGPPPTSSPPSTQSHPHPQPQTPLVTPAAGQRVPPIVNGGGAGGGFKAEFAFGQARLRDLIKRYQGQTT
jgi:hypothetical protein